MKAVLLCVLCHEFMELTSKAGNAQSWASTLMPLYEAIMVSTKGYLQESICQ